jgi:hypothetical protein
MGSIERSSNVMDLDAALGASFILPSIPIAVGVDKLNRRAS